MVHRLHKIIYVLALFIALSPLVFFTAVLYPFTFAKAMYIQSIVEIMVLLVCVVWLKRKVSWASHSPIVWAFSIFVLLGLVSAMQGVNFHQSMWSDMARSLGSFFWVHVAFLLMVLSSSLVTDRQWVNILFVFYGSITIVGLIGIIQKFYPAFLVGTAFGGSTESIRVASTLGNPIYLAAVLLFAIFAVPFLWQYTHARWQQCVLLGATVLNVISLIFTGTRGGLVGLAAGLGACALILAYTSKHPRFRNIATIMLCALIAMCIILWANRDAAWLKGTPLHRVVSAVYERRGTIETRLINWRVALKGFQSRPLLGWGPENFRFIADKFFEPRLLRFSFYETRVDKPHNMWLEVLSTTGAVGAFAYGAIFVLVLAALGRLYRSGQIGRLSSAGFVATLTAYGAQNAFAFDTHITLLAFVMTLTTIVREISPCGAQRLVPTEQRTFFSMNQRLPMTVLAVLAIGASLVFYHVFPTISAYHTNRGLFLLKQEDWLKASGQFHQGLRIFSPYHFESWRWFGDSLVKFGRALALVNGGVEFQSATLKRLEDDTKLLLEETGRLRQQYRSDPLLLSFVGKMYYQLGLLGNNQDAWHQAEEVFEELIRLAPARQEPSILLGQTKLVLKKYDEAIGLFEHAVARDPLVADSQWFLGYAKYISGDRHGARAPLTAAFDLGFRNFESKSQRELISAVFTVAEDYERLEKLYEHLTRESPGEAELWARLALIYAKRQRYLEARSAAAVAVRLDPSFQAEADQFLKTLPPEQ